MNIIGLDIGTSRVKAVRFDAEWRAVDSAAEESTVHFGADGRREQDMHAVAASAFRVVSSLAHRSPDIVDLLAVTAQGDGCWLVDQQNEPVGRALLWNDARAAALVDRWDTDGTSTSAFAINGCSSSPGLANALLRWLRDHEPDLLTRADCLLSCGSWVYERLTGRRALDVSDAANPFLDARIRDYDKSLLDLYGIEDLANLLPELVDGPDRIAPLTDNAAHDLGLRAGTPVALAPYDVVATAYGAGAVLPGDAVSILGTTLCVGVLAEEPRLSRQPNGMTLPAVTPGQWLISYATMIGTEVLDWAVQLLNLGDTAALMSLAATAQPGAQPLLLPYLSPAGERSPFRDSAVRGSLLGLTVEHTRADIARAVVDGLTLAVRDCLTAAGGTDRIAVCGGGARSPLWCQALSDATASTVTAADTAEVGARGAALIGAVALGRYPDIASAAADAIGIGAEYQPNPAETARFDQLYADFRSSRTTGS